MTTKQKHFLSEKSATILAVFIAGLCSIIYELLISTTTSYFLGDSIKQFSITIGVYMAAMGLGSYWSKYFERDILSKFVLVELSLGTIGGLSVPILYYFFEYLDRFDYQMLTITLIAIIGTLTGLEIPLLARIMKQYYPLKVNLANVLSLDYLGALLATLLFPFILLPFLGIFRSSVFFGMVNIALGLFILWFFSAYLTKSTRNRMQLAASLSMLLFVALIVFTKPLLDRWDDQAFTHRIIFSKQTPYQHLVMTKNKADVRLYINRIIQFSSLDEYRYHEALALVPLNVTPYPKQVLILGGGEGLLAREVLKHPAVEQVTIVDLDAEVFRLAKENKHLVKLNEDILHHPKVKTIATDAFNFLNDTPAFYDLILADLPDPSNEAVARLYSTQFFQLVQNRLSRQGVFATQASGVFHTNAAFWCIHNTLQASGFQQVYPYHAYIPAFGDWGFIVAANHRLDVKDYRLDVPTRFLDKKTVAALFSFEKDLLPETELAPNEIDRPTLLEYY
ncbi:MAG: polyamine aminopropyltransferase, partial [Bacteroidota bacterium]